MTVPGFPVRDKSGQKKNTGKRQRNVKTAGFRKESPRFFIGNQSDIFMN
jgi:hypothetical protein